MLAEGLLISVSAVAAVATIALAYTAWRTVRLNQEWLAVAREQLSKLGEEVQAVKQQAEASQRTVEEMLRDREQAYAPHLRISVEEWWIPTLFQVENIGRGSALNCRLVHAEFSGDPQQWSRCSTELFTLAPGEKTTSKYAEGSLWEARILDDLRLWAPDSSDGITACVCEDQLGIKRRFVVGQLLQGVAGQLRSPDPLPDVWRPGDPETPWVRWY